MRFTIMLGAATLAAVFFQLSEAVYTRTTSPVCVNGIFSGGICQYCQQNCTSCS